MICFTILFWVLHSHICSTSKTGLSDQVWYMSGHLFDALSCSESCAEFGYPLSCETCFQTLGDDICLFVCRLCSSVCPQNTWEFQMLYFQLVSYENTLTVKKKSTNSIGQIENMHIFEVSHFFKVTKRQLSDDKGKYCTSPVVVCWMPEVSGRLLAWQQT